jgi:hypothetical protein
VDGPETAVRNVLLETERVGVQLVENQGVEARPQGGQILRRQRGASPLLTVLLIGRTYCTAIEYIQYIYTVQHKKRNIRYGRHWIALFTC